MKKLFAAALAIIFALGMIGCAAQDNIGGQTAAAVDPLELLATVWNSFGEDQKFAVIGGDYSEENMKDGEPGNVAIDGESLEYLYTFPAAMADKVESGAGLIHALNSNSFTAGAFKLNNAADAQDVCSAIRDALNSKHWMCGFPDKMLIANVNGCVVSVYGGEDNVNNFKDKLVAAYSDAEIVYDEGITA